MISIPISGQWANFDDQIPYLADSVTGPERPEILPQTMVVKVSGRPHTSYVIFYGGATSRLLSSP